ncbi:MAG TPA: hypothetical protein VHY91_27070 [Pirellulales bacterium]|nr:hypothetical protein [Pirellulales bacterium]
MIAWLVLLASLALGGIGWLVAESGTFAVTWHRSPIDEPKDLSPPDDSAAGTGETSPTTGGPAGSKAAPSPPATPAEARQALDHSIKSIKLHRVWDGTYNALATYQSRSDDADLSLNTLYLWELSRLQGSRAKTTQRNASLSAIAQLQAEIDTLDFSTKSYFLSYIQWYELLMWSYEDNDETWSANGKAANRIKALVYDVSPHWGLSAYKKHGPRYRMDGSLASVGMYVIISLYLNRDKVNYSVGERLDVAGAPAELVPANERKLVILLDRLVSFVESCYDGKEPDSTVATFRYSPAGPERGSLVGGKILYFLAKAVLAEQRNQDADATVYYDRAFDVLKILDNDRFASLHDTYEFVYVVRGLTQLLRLSVKREDHGRAKELVTMADALMAKDYPPENARHSQFYLPIAYLNYYNDSWLALREMNSPVLENVGK